MIYESCNMTDSKNLAKAAEYKVMFDKYDADKNGSIDVEELLKLVQDWGIEAWIPETDVRGIKISKKKFQKKICMIFDRTLYFLFLFQHFFFQNG